MTNYTHIIRQLQQEATNLNRAIEILRTLQSSGVTTPSTSTGPVLGTLRPATTKTDACLFRLQQFGPGGVRTKTLRTALAAEGITVKNPHLGSILRNLAKAGNAARIGRGKWVATSGSTKTF